MRLPYLLPAVALAILMSSCAPKSAVRAPAAPAASVAGNAVHLTAYTDNDGPTSTVVLDGAVGDFGQARRDKNELDLVLAHGSFRLDIGDLERTFAGGLNNLAINTATCSATASVRGAVPVAAGSGTGSYRRISGTFDLTITLDEVYTPNSCTETSAYLAQSIVITGPGTVVLR
ncbi:hypothetical protein [Paractinoplanes globisporus]|uniref:Lipoprotein n=1 Tax=Paractinoplanes globisporus TaxID=113565 RepID=A0ABW6WHI1_9ACTN|nr:hypothetical protein [Actinoplanes globisporus]